MTYKIMLKVGKAEHSEVGRDIVRINYRDRPKFLKRHDIVWLRVGGLRRLVTVRGNDAPGVINIDIDNREDLEIEEGSEYEFDIELAWAWRRVWWQLWATDPTVRMPAKIAAWSFAMGFVGLALGIYSVWPHSK